MKKKWLQTLILIVIFGFSCSLLAHTEKKETNILFILDASGSMNQIIQGKTKLNTAKEVLTGLLGDLPSTTKVGLMVYGNSPKQDKKGCEAINLSVPISKLDEMIIKKQLNLIQANGKTPIAASLEKGAEAIKGLGGKKTIVLISDGEETCGGDPIKVAEKIKKELGIDVVIHVVGFDVKDEERAQLASIARAGGGTYYPANNAQELKTSLIQIKEEATEEESSKDIFVEEFDQPFLGEDWEILNDTPDNRTLEDGIFYVIASPGEFVKGSVQNMLIYSKPIGAKNYEVLTKFKASLTDYESIWFEGQQWVGLVFYGDKNTLLALVVRSEYNYQYRGGRTRGALFYKTKEGKSVSESEVFLGGKDFNPYIYYLKVQKHGFKYTGYVSTDGQKWQEVGTLSMLGKKLRPGIFAVRGSKAREFVAEFDSFKIKELK